MVACDLRKEIPLRTTYHGVAKKPPWGRHIGRSKVEKLTPPPAPTKYKPFPPPPPRPTEPRGVMAG